MEKVLINTCSAEDLTTLPGVDLGKAQRLLRIRAQVGEFTPSSFEDMADLVGIAQPQDILPYLDFSVTQVPSNPDGRVPSTPTRSGGSLSEHLPSTLSGGQHSSFLPTAGDIQSGPEDQGPSWSTPQAPKSYWGNREDPPVLSPQPGQRRDPSTPSTPPVLQAEREESFARPQRPGNNLTQGAWLQTQSCSHHHELPTPHSQTPANPDFRYASSSWGYKSPGGGYGYEEGGQRCRSNTFLLRPPRDVSLPKSITYDGTGQWRTFFFKFQAYASQSGWTAEECTSQLYWCLQGSAADFFTALVQRNPNLQFYDLTQQLQDRFDRQLQPELAHVEFAGARQAPSESLVEWADRLTQLASQAFLGIPLEQLERQIITRFCQGCSDRETGLQVLSGRHATIKEATMQAQWLQQAARVLGKQRKEVRCVTRIEDPSPLVQRVVVRSPDQMPSGRGGEDRLSNVEKGLTTIKSRLAQSQTDLRKGLHTQISPLAQQVGQLTAMVKQLCQQAQSPSPAPKRPHSRALSPATRTVSTSTPQLAPPSHRTSTPGVCVNCGGRGHSLKECPSPQNDVSTANSSQAVPAGVKEIGELNREGPGEEANPCPELDKANLPL